MSIGSPKSRPSQPLGPQPLVTSRSAPDLQSALPGAAGTGIERRALLVGRSPSPEPATRLVRQLHPVVNAGGQPPPPAYPDARQDTGQESKHSGQAGAAQGSLVRFVGGFLVPSQARLEEDNDVFTVVADSIQRSVQQQPDSALPSSGEATPQARPVTPIRPDEGVPSLSPRTWRPATDNSG